MWCKAAGEGSEAAWYCYWHSTTRPAPYSNQGTGSANKFHPKTILLDQGIPFIKPSPEWVSATGKLTEGLYYTDHMHLVEPGNTIIAKQMASIIPVALAHNNEPPKIVPPVVLHNHSIAFYPTL